MPVIAKPQAVSNEPAHDFDSSLREPGPLALNPLQAAVGRQQAARIARQAIERRTGKSARVTWIGREDDYGARWEIEVTLRSGQEFDVYVNSAGKVVKIIRKRGTER